jgi:hypothetical protein
MPYITRTRTTRYFQCSCYENKSVDSADSGYTPAPLDLAHISFDDDDDLQLLQEGSPLASHDDIVDREAGNTPFHLIPSFFS